MHVVRFKDDLELLHHPWIIGVLGGYRYWAAAPDREVWLTRFGIGDKYSQIMKFSGGRTAMPGRGVGVTSPTTTLILQSSPHSQSYTCDSSYIFSLF